MTSVDEISNMTGLSFNSDDSANTDAKTYCGNNNTVTTNNSASDEEIVSKKVKGKAEDTPILISSQQSKSLEWSNNDKPSIEETTNQPPLSTIEKIDISTATGIDHCWSIPESKTFQVRSKTYLDDKVKVESSNSLFQRRGVDFFMTNETGDTNIGRHNGILGGNLRKKPTFIVNFRFPWGVLVFYYEIQSRYLPLLKQKYVDSPTKDDYQSVISFDDFTSEYNTAHDRAMYRFIMGDDSYRNSKLKLIPKVIEGNVIVRKLVYGKPVIIGKKLPVTYVYEPANPSEGKAEYWEADLDIGSSSARGKKIVGVCKKYITSLTVDMGFLIEGDCESELPERILASTRIHHFNPESCQIIQY